MQTGLTCFELIARINQINVDIRSIVREHGVTEDELSKEELIRIIKNFEFRVKLKKISLELLDEKYPLPAIAVMKDNSYIAILKLNKQDKKMLVYAPLEKTTKEYTFQEFEEISTGEFLILSHKMINAQIKFGFGWFFNEILTYKRVIAEVLLGSFIIQLFGLVTPLFTQVILDKVIVHRTTTTLDVLAFAFIAVMIFEFLLNISRRYIFIHTACKIDAKLGAKIFKHLFALPFVYFESRKVGNIISRIRELDQIRDFITNKSVSVIIDLFFSLVFVVIMFLYSVSLSLVVLLFVLLITILYLVITPELRNRLNDKFYMGAMSQSYLVESVTGVQTVKSLAIEGAMQKKWEDYLGGYVKSGFKLANMGNFSGALSGLFQKAMTITILYVGVKLVIANKLTIGQLIAFQMFSGQFTGPILRLVGLWNEFQQTLLAVDRIGDILNSPIEITSSKLITLPKLAGSVKFDNISFKYSVNTPNVLENISFNIAPGQSVGIVGRSGSGKSTVAKLIQRLYLTNEGAIYVDGVDIRQMNPLWLRSNIGMVLQENYLFSGPIRDNIAMPKPDSPIEHIIHVSKIAGADEFISQLPEGYDTMVGERGSTLSGGQKQRVAIARALITDPRILIFDEATSALDYESERIILENLDKIKRGRTTFIIAHRLSAVRSCDVIIVFEKGHIIEFGTHDELIAKKGYYHYLTNQQHGITKG
ncbi:MAG: type I secretion system permease/ATPase [Candidatus Gastranaerophilaceae bacterium]|jgi:subfamily B ATP-binding cassette protein HlyB/CyaB